MAELELKNVFKDYKLENKTKFTALTDINLSFDKGELVSIIGESGSGKSTLMNLIGGLDSDYSGQIVIDGIDLKTFKDKQLDDYRKKKIGFVFQSFNLIPHLSVIDNVTIALTLSNVKESVKNQKAIELLTKLGLKDHIKKKPTQLSGGQKQRVAIARALINNPDIILADEPTGALDSETTSQILDILKDIADNDNKLVIMVTHSEKVAKISSRIVEISDGKVIRDEFKKDYVKTERKERLLTSLETDDEQDKSQQNASEKQNSGDTQGQNAKNKVSKNAKKKEGHLSFFSALKLSFHNMWASKTKNILMAVGVSISLISLILMLSLGSGLTGYIDSLAQDYSNPNYVTISKSGLDRDGNELEESSNFMIPRMFENSEIEEISSDINSYLANQGNDFRIETTGENINLTYGFSAPTIGMGTISLPAGGSTEDTTNDETQNADESQSSESGDVQDGENDSQTSSSKPQSIMFTYTTPPYYGDEKIIAGEMSGDGEIMLSSAAIDYLGYENAEEMFAKGNKPEVLLTINMEYDGTAIRIDKLLVKVSGIIDVSVFSNMMVMYLDYGFLNQCVMDAQVDAGVLPTGLKPSLLFIETDGKSTTDMINRYIQTSRKDLSGSIEEQLASMFSEMMSTFSLALAIIAGISLVVALIMILVVLYMSVTERTREIGVLKSIGARKKDIKLIFSTESLLIGLLSGIVGIILSLVLGGILSAVLTAVLGFAPIRMMWYFFAEALLISIVISVIAGVYPASKAAKLDPVESLRHE